MAIKFINYINRENIIQIMIGIIGVLVSVVVGVYVLYNATHSSIPISGLC